MKDSYETREDEMVEMPLVSILCITFNQEKSIALSEEGKWKEIKYGEYADCFSWYSLPFKARLFIRCKAPHITGLFLGRK